MEHVVPEDVDDILEHIALFSNHLIYFLIDNGSTYSTSLADQSKKSEESNFDWWRETLSRHFSILVCQHVDGLTTQSDETLGYSQGATLVIVAPIIEVFDSHTKIVGGRHLPKSDIHFRDKLSAGRYVQGKRTYQFEKLNSSTKRCKSRHLALDIGAHVGLWSYFLSFEFDQIISFEPIDEHIRCFKKNIEKRKNVKLMPIALGSSSGTLSMIQTKENSGMSHVAPNMSGIRVESIPLDTLEYKNIDFIKLDVEGYETEVIRGARETILENRPAIILEQNPSI